MSRFCPQRPTAVALMLLLLTGVSGCFEQGEKKNDVGALTLYGNIDIREVQLAFQDAGRILNLEVDEGARVKKGQEVARLDPVRFQLEVDRLRGEAAAQGQLLDRLRSGSRPQEIEKTRAAVVAAQANLKEAELTLARKQSLLQTNRISQQEIDAARARATTLAAQLKAAEEELSLTLEGPRREDVAAAESTQAALQTARELAEKRLADTRLSAPADGYIRNRILEPGAMAASGTPVLTLALTDPLWVRAYVSEPDLGKVREGMAAALRSDSLPGKVYKGWVGFIASTAEFTPKTVETTELRTKLVYRARVFACDPQQELRLGMPMTVTIDTAQGAVGDKPRCD